jgi:transcriptional regulator
MYTPKAFEVTDLPMLHSVMKQSELATLVSNTTQGLVATHLPLLLDETRGEYGTLIGHVSRANAQWRETDPKAEALIIFLGLDAYVSPNWYPAKQETGRVVPTWNYAAIHAYGRITFFEDVERLRTVVTELTQKHEASFPAPNSRRLSGLNSKFFASKASGSSTRIVPKRTESGLSRDCANYRTSARQRSPT